MLTGKGGGVIFQSVEKETPVSVEMLLFVIYPTTSSLELDEPP